MQKILILILLTLFSSSLITQTKLDSLLGVWNDTTQPDSSRVTAYFDYLWNGYLFSKPDSAAVLADILHIFSKEHNYPRASALGYHIQGSASYLLGENSRTLEYYEKTLEIYEELGDKKGIAITLGNIGLIYSVLSNYPRALEYYQKSLAIKEEVGDKKGIAITLGNMGIIYRSQGNYPRALDYYQKSLAIDEEIRANKGIAGTLGNIGNIYWDQGNYPPAMEYYQKALTIYEELGDKRGIATNLNNIGNIYDKQDETTRALEFYQKSLAIKEEIGDKNETAGTLNNIGTIYYSQGNYSRALEYYQKSLTIKEEIGDKRGIALSLGNIGGLYQKQGKATLALDYCQKSLTLAEEIGALDWQKSACQCLYNAYKAIGKGNEALVYLEKMNVISDSLQTQETTKKLEQMEFAKVMLQDSISKAEEDRLVQEAHQAEVRKKNQMRNLLIGSSLFLLLLAIGMYSRWRYVLKSREIISKEKDRSDSLLLNILPAEIAEELKQKGRADARDFDMVSILFTDFKEFTQTSEKLSAQELVGEINACFEAFDTICGKYGVEKIKTIGDAYMAAGGLPVPSDDSVKNTVLAALEMQAFIQKRKAENETAGKPAFEMRVGIHTGPVVAGIVGVKKFQYDIWGDTVNTASRMESHGEVGKVNISQNTYELLKDDPDFKCESRGKVEAKGKGEVEMYFASKK